MKQKSPFSDTVIKDTAVSSTAAEFVKFLDETDVPYDIEDANNILDYNEGMLNLHIWRLKHSYNILFIDGEYQN